MGTTKLQNFSIPKICFLHPSDADFNGTIIFEIGQKGGYIAKKCDFGIGTPENDPLKCHNSRENAARRIAN